MIKNASFVVVDLETTGLEPSLDRIIEIGVVIVKNGKIVKEYSQLVNPGVFIPDIVTNITGITTEMVKDSPYFEDIADEFIELFDEDSIFVAHNVDFDRSFVNIHMDRLGKPTVVKNPHLCTFRLAKRVHPNLNKYSLGSLAALFGIDLENAHRALDDARATALLMLKFLDVLEEGGLRQLKDIPGIQNLPKKAVEQAKGQVSLF